MTIKKKINVGVFVLISSFLFGQNQKFSAIITPVVADGYYKIVLSPALLGKCAPNKADFRIVSDQKKECPFVLYKEQETTTQTPFVAMPILASKVNKTGSQELIIQNINNIALQQLEIRIKNAYTIKTMVLSGSNNGKDWYVVRDSFDFLINGNSSSTKSSIQVDFPRSDYGLFKIQIEDGGSLPIHILDVGYTSYFSTQGQYNSFIFPIESERDSAKMTFVHLKLPDDHYFENLLFTISGASFYSRRARLFRWVEVEKKKGRSSRLEKEYITEFELNSQTEPRVDLVGISTSDLWLEVDNKNDAPLHFELVEATSLKQYALCKLAINENYTIEFGNNSAAKPLEFDLNKFANEFYVSAPEINHMPISPITEEKTMSKLKNKSPVLLWSVLIGIGIVLLFFSVKMIREIK